jgi:glycosyltransferase involved in cell wall biosynthesis
MAKKLNICIVQPNKSAYSETFIQNHIKYLPANIYVLYGPWLPEFTGDGQHISEYFINRNIFSYCLSRLLKFLPQVIYSKIPAVYTGWPKNENHLASVAVEYYFKKNKIDAVLAEYGFKGVLVLDICKKLKIPLTTYFLGCDAYDRQVLRQFKTGYVKLFKESAAIIVVSEAMRQQLIGFGADQSRLHINYMGTDLDLFKFVNIANNPPVIVSTGRFVEKKAPFLTILAFSLVNKKFPDSRLIMIGDGPLLDCCKMLSSALGLCDFIDFKGALTNKEVAEIMQKSRMAVLHSVVACSGDSEGTPVCLIEAGAVGLPVVSTRHGGIPDLVIDGVTGLLSDEKDIETMARNMIRLIEDSAYAGHLGANARKRIEEKFSLNTTINNLYKIIEKSVGNSN